MFVKYNDKKQSSYIDSYQIGDDYIDIIFKKEPNTVYHYSYLKPGEFEVECMKAAALNRSGLTGYLDTHCRYFFEYKTKIKR